MKKIILSIIVIASVISACSIDDICTEPSTPNLVLRFYDVTSTSTLKSTDSLYVWAEGKDSILVNQAVDSIAIPLNSEATATVYNFAKGRNLLNKITITYTPESEYVSRSCGYRIIFNDANLDLSTPANGWISSIAPRTSIATINSQTSAHVQVFH